MSQSYTSILFDVDGTLLDFKAAEKYALNKIYSRLAPDLPEQEFLSIYKEINQKIWIELEKGEITAGELKVERFARVIKALGSQADPMEYAEFYLNYLGESSVFLSGAVELIEKLHKHYRLGIITNGLKQVQDTRLNRPEFNDYFEACVISEEEGVSKPDKKLFEILASKMDINLDKSVIIVGDSLTSDIAGGNNAGITTCWYNPGKWENQSPAQVDIEIHDLSELAEKLSPAWSAE